MTTETTTQARNEDIDVINVVKATVAANGTIEDAAEKLGMKVSSLGNRISTIKRQLRENGFPEEVIQASLPPFPGRSRGGKKKDGEYFRQLAKMLGTDLSDDAAEGE